MPYSIQAEQSVLGSILLDKDSIVMVMLLDRKDFHKKAACRNFEAMIRLYQKGEPIDLITVMDALGKKALNLRRQLPAQPDLSLFSFTYHNILYKIVKENPCCVSLFKLATHYGKKLQ